MSTISLCIICKNERQNLPRLLDSVKSCFDNIHITDTGSTDGTIEYLEELQKKGELHLHHFKWIDDFAAARNYSFSHAQDDYVMWLDCDDVLANPEAFRQWKTDVMPIANYWMNTYHYSINEKGEPTCSFMRERVIQNRIGYEWMHFVHEGILPVTNDQNKPNISYATSWHVRHMRTQKDIEVDRHRNLNIFEKNLSRMDARLAYYYGKELFEAQKPMEAFTQLLKTSKEAALEPQDRILCIQYCAMAAMMCNQYDTAIQTASVGLQLAPNRAELYCIIGDCYLRKQQLDSAIPSFVAAANCINSTPNSAVFQGAIFTQADAYGHYPRNQLARINFHAGRMNEAKKWLEQALLLGPNVETGSLYAEILNQEKLHGVPSHGSIPIVNEYVITSPMQTPYVWDEEVAKTRGIGGSETAVVQMARHLHKLTGKVVRIFHERPEKLELDGVVYESNANAKSYFAQHQPLAHIAWRHNVKITNAPTFLWCHDLMAPGIENHSGYDKVLTLSQFHKQYLQHIFSVPEEKLLLTRNGIDLSRFEGVDFGDKNADKVVFSSSPDRGLDRAVAVVAKARELSGRNLELHAFYGFDNMLKLGLHKQVADLQAMLALHPWVKLHGNVQQNELVKHLASAKVWLYPTNFLETYCITALEMLACRVRPVVRAWGALPHTLKDMPCELVDLDCQTDAEIEVWAKQLLVSLDVNQPIVDMARFSWESVAREWSSWLPK